MFEYKSINHQGNLHQLAADMNSYYRLEGWEIVTTQVVDLFLIVVLLRRQIAPLPYQYAAPVSTSA